MISRLSRSLFFAVLAPLVVAAQTREPLFDFGSLLDSVRIRPESGQLWIGGDSMANIHAAFLPPPAEWNPNDPARSNGQMMWAALRGRNGGHIVAKIPLFVEAIDERFSNLRPIPLSNELINAGYVMECTVTRAGDYDFDIHLNDRVVARLPFTVKILETGDEFAPTRVITTEGAWSQWGYLAMKMDDPNPPVEFRCWLRKITPATTPAEPLSLQVVCDGVVVAETPATFPSTANWQRFNFQLAAPSGKARGVFARNEIFSRDGTYLVTLRRGDGGLDSVFRFVWQNGQLQAHPRHASNYEPRFEAILPRKWAPQPGARRQTWWTERLTGAAAEALLAENAPAPVAGPSATDRARWLAPVDAALATLPLTVTTIATRHDTNLAVGNGIMVYGSGGFTGVGYAKVGDSAAQSIPGGTDFHANLFAACGRKIVLVDRNRHVSVFDTTTNTMTAIPAPSATISKLVGGPFKSAPLAGDGMLVGIITEEAAVADRGAVKVIDVSGAQPVVLSLRVPDGVLARNLNAIAVDAANGKVAVSSKDKRALYVGDIADGATLTACDLSGHDGIADAPILVRGGFVLYRDNAGSSGRARLWDFAKSGVVTPVFDALPGSLRGVAINATHFAAAVDPSRGSTYRIAVAPLTGGETSYATDAGPGRGSSVALTADGLVVVGGSGSLGSDAFLHVRRPDGVWIAIKGADGNPVPAGDVVACGPLIAFKTGRSTNVTLAYVSAATLAAATP